MTAKLYKVRITEIFGTHRVDMSEYWISATSPTQAKKRGLKQANLGSPYSSLHVEAICYRGGTQHIRTTTLRAAA